MKRREEERGARWATKGESERRKKIRVLALYIMYF